jgi:hypothetical protein
MLEFLTLTAIVVALTQLIKGYFPSKWVPLVSVALAIALSTWSGLSQHLELFPSVLDGLIAGLTANGFYDNVTKPWKS